MSKKTIKLKKGKKNLKKSKKVEDTVEETIEIDDVIVATPPKINRNDLFEYEGKLYAVGSIISVGYGPYLAKKRKYGRKKKVTIIPVSENVESGAGEEVAGRDGGEDGDDGADDEWQGEYGADKPTYEKSEDGDNIGSDEDAEGVIQPVKQKQPKRKYKKPTWEEELIFKEKEVDILSGEALDIAKKMGLPYKKSKFVGEPVKYKVIEHDLRYRGYDKYIVAEKESEDGAKVLYLKPYSPPRVDKIQVFDGDFLPPPVPVFAFKTVEKGEPPASYTGSFKLGDRITFTLTESKEKDVEGAVLKVTDTTFTIVDPNEGSKGKIYSDVEYKNAQNLRFKNIPEKYLSAGKTKPEVHVGKKVYKIDTKTITSKDNYLAKTSRKFPFRYAEFTLVEPKVEHLEGVITDYSEDGFIVSILEKRSKTVAQTVVVGYDNASIKKIGERPSIKEAEKGIVNVAEDYLHLLVETSTRVNATKRLFQILAGVLDNTQNGTLDGIYDSPVDTDPLLVKISTQVNWALANSEFEDWEVYYGKQFKQWLVSTLYMDVFKSAPSFKKEAQDEYEASTNPVLIIEGLVYVFGDIFTGNAARCLAMMSSESKKANFRPTIIDIAIRRELTKLDTDDLESIEGQELALVISRIIAGTLKTNPPPNTSSIENRLKHDWSIEEITTSYNPPETVKRSFDDEYLDKIQAIYDEYVKEWKYSKEKKKEYTDLRKTLIQERSQREKIQKTVPRLRLLTVDGRQLSQKGLMLADNVSMLEEKIYIEAHSGPEGSTNGKYLHEICKLFMFLDSENEIGKYATFFRSKITSGLYDVSGLDSQSIFHMFPEFFANTENSDEIYGKGQKLIEMGISLDVIDFIDIYVLGNAPRIRDTTFGAKFIWANYIESVQKLCGGMRMKKGASYLGADNAENYDCEPIINDEKHRYMCQAKLEPIPDSDLILCYDEKLKRFTCASINDVLYALWEESNGRSPINPMTGGKYAEDFLDRMRERYGDLYETGVKEGIFHKRIMRFVATDERLLFGGDEPEVVVY